MESYRHKVQYYETDKMGITHHSNYIRWMEEARTDFLSRVGADYAKLEEEGIISPVTSVKCKYLRTSTFEDEIYIELWVESFNNIKLVLNYEMKKADGTIVCRAESEHCFLNEDGRLARVNKLNPKLSELFAGLVRSAK